jgi:alpha-galactosidase
MMSAPLILSSDVGKLSPDAIAILGNTKVIAIDQDPLGNDATLVRRTQEMDLLLKPLKDRDYAVEILNRGDSLTEFHIHPVELGFAASPGCTLDADNLWTDNRQASLSNLGATLGPHDSAIWRIHPNAACGLPTRTGAIVMTTDKPKESIDGYAHCLAAAATVEDCSGTPGESWTITSGGELKSGGGCLAFANGRPTIEACDGSERERWEYTLSGNLVNAGDNMCLTNQSAGTTGQPATMQPCGHNQPNQIWSLPN